MNTTPRGARPGSRNEASTGRSNRDREHPASPSDQLLRELTRLQLREQESFQARLDEDAERRATAHREALAASSAEHDRIRQVAEAVRQQEELKLQIERQGQKLREQRRVAELQREREQQERAAAEEAQRQLQEEERIRREAEERKNRAAEEAKQREAAAAAAAKRRDEEAAAKVRQQQEEAEAQKKRQQDIENRAKERIAAAAATNSQPKPAQASPPQPQPQQPQKPPVVVKAETNGAVGASSISPEREAEHERYLAIHQNLKEFRTWMKEQSATNKALKDAMRETRNDIRVRYGQLKLEPKENKLQILSIKNTFKKVNDMAPQPTVDITRFLRNPPPSSPQTQVPAIFIYFVNIFCKKLLAQTITEGTAKPAMANAYGVFAVTFLGSDDWSFNQRSLIDILIARLHRDCPPLFGINGVENTSEGRRRLGWKQARDHNGEKSGWVPTQAHEQQMQGTAAVFASITLRNYTKSRALRNPYPPWYYWNAVALITNLPAEEISDSHAHVVRSMIEYHVPRIVEAFGEPAVLMLRHAMVDFPRKIAKQSAAVRQLSLVREKLAKEDMLLLE